VPRGQGARSCARNRGQVLHGLVGIATVRGSDAREAVGAACEGGIGA